ncbi:unnamed protein product [Prorocentrum cordatum]|uniref:Uncharacterized protein n=1 Tax=Prorocentrum cordatum TaxID=2364126 RepID=A0ABN9YH94_9DINO|nr:unnamed protein product [Polarella glacialis]
MTCAPCAGPDEAARPAWQATLWKRSSFLRVWRRRHMRLEGTAGGPWRLTSWADDGDDASPTGTWELSEGEELANVGPRFGYCAVLEVQGVVLAADSKDDSSDALRELLGLLGRRPARETKSARSPPSPRAPQCEECWSELAKGQVVGLLQGGAEVRKWLCRRCFVASWATIAEPDGRWAERSPRWMLRGRSGALQDATPPPLRRYATAFPGHCRHPRDDRRMVTA